MHVANIMLMLFLTEGYPTPHLSYIYIAVQIYINYSPPVARNQAIGWQAGTQTNMKNPAAMNCVTRYL